MAWAYNTMFRTAVLWLVGHTRWPLFGLFARSFIGDVQVPIGCS